MIMTMLGRGCLKLISNLETGERAVQYPLWGKDKQWCLCSEVDLSDVFLRWWTCKTLWHKFSLNWGWRTVDSTCLPLWCRAHSSGGSWKVPGSATLWRFHDSPHSKQWILPLFPKRDFCPLAKPHRVPITLLQKQKCQAGTLPGGTHWFWSHLRIWHNDYMGLQRKEMLKCMLQAWADSYHHQGLTTTWVGLEKSKCYWIKY